MVNKIDINTLKSLDISNLHRIKKNGRVIGVRGQTLLASKNRKHLRTVKKAGVDTIIDLRSDNGRVNSIEFVRACKAIGLEYHHLPIDKAYTSDMVIIKNLNTMINIIDRGGFYISCDEGLTRTDIALSLWYLFNPKAGKPPLLYGYITNGELRGDDIFRRANSVYRNLTADDKNCLGWDEAFNAGFGRRKKLLVEANRDKSIKSKIIQITKHISVVKVFKTIKYICVATFNHTIDIHSKAPGVGGRLSNFTRRDFIFDDVRCRSIEGVLQSFKFDDSECQKEVCMLFGSRAKRAGEKQDWKTKQVLFWKAVAYDRNSAEYHQLLDSLYSTVYMQDASFRSDIEKCTNKKLTHSIGGKDISETILTEKEFCDCLKSLQSNRKIRKVTNTTALFDNLDIGARDSVGAAARLSNFTERHFIFDGVFCASIEGVLQSLKFEDVERQRSICRLVGIEAKKAGRKADWKSTQTLHWNGVIYYRDSEDYQKLLNRLFETVFNQSLQFVNDLYETSEYKLIHSIGKTDPTETILTEREFCDRLEILRNTLK